MEKYSQYRDRATGIAPFLPVTTPLSALSTVIHTLLFGIRLPFFLTYIVTYFLLLQWLPLPVFARKIALWGLIAIPGIWWVDLQLDGVKRGTLSEQPRDRFPHPGSLIAANFTSPIDAIYLAAVFDPLFVRCWPDTRKVQRINLLQAVAMALAPVSPDPPPGLELVSLKDLLDMHPNRVIAVFPESGTTNGKAILPISHCLLPIPADVRIYPVSIRYSPSDVTTPVPGRLGPFIWNLLSRPTICVRVRIAESLRNRATAMTNGTGGQQTVRRGEDSGAGISVHEALLLDSVGEALARLSRVKRVSLTMDNKAEFVQAWDGKKP